MDGAALAFGKPGIGPTCSSSTKDVVTTGLGPSRVWATLGYGIIIEVYWPATGSPQARDLGFIVARDGSWTELKRANRYRVTLAKPLCRCPRWYTKDSGTDLLWKWSPIPPATL